MAAAKGRLMETMAKNTEAYESLKSLSDGMPEIDIENTTQDAFKLVSDSKAPFVSVKENNEIVDFLMDYDLRRLWLKNSDPKVDLPEYKSKSQETMLPIEWNISDGLTGYLQAVQDYGNARRCHR